MHEPIDATRDATRRRPRRVSRAPWYVSLFRSALERHPVSITRHKLGCALLACLILALGIYAFSTRDAAIRGRAIAFLQKATGGEITVGQSTFNLFGGTTLSDVHIHVPFDPQFDPVAKLPAEREIFSAASLKLIHNPWRLLTGTFRIDRIIAVQPMFTLVHNADTGVRNWELLFSGKLGGPAPPRISHRPMVTIRSATVKIVSVSADRKPQSDQVKLDADVRPHLQIDTAYAIELRRFSEPADRTTVIFDPGSSLLANTPFVEATTIRLQLPRLYQRFFDRVALRGQVKLTRMIYDPRRRQGADNQIDLRDVRCAVPLSLFRKDATPPATNSASAPAPDSADNPDDCSVFMTHAHGQMVLRGERLDVDMAGRINGADCQITGSLDRVDGPLAEMGMDLEVNCQNLPLPEGGLREQLTTDPSLPKNLRDFFGDYDPHGEVDVACRLTRPAGAPSALTFSGTVRPLGTDGSFYLFPFRIHNLHGEIRNQGDHTEVENLLGEHAGARINVNARIDRTTRCATAAVDITGAKVPLDEELHAALSPRFRQLWTDLDLRGAADITVQMRRPGTNEPPPNPPWQNTISADLLDAQIRCRQFPYHLDNVHGHVRIQSDQITMEALTGHHGAAVVQIDGTADLQPDRPPTLQLKLKADSLPLDDALAAALPPEGRGAFMQFKPTGLVNLAGTVALIDPVEGVVYDLVADLRDTRLQYDQVPCLIENVRGRIAIRPENISVLELQGEYEHANIVVKGSIRRLPPPTRPQDDSGVPPSSGYIADLSLDCRSLPAGPQLCEKLPAPIRQICADLQLEGPTSVLTQLHVVSNGAEQWHRHRTEVSFTDGKLLFAPFPLPMTGVSANALVTDRRVEIAKLRGIAGNGTIALAGQIDLTDGARRGSFEVAADDMTFDDTLMSALPSDLRKPLIGLRPRGQFDLELDALRFDSSAPSPDAPSSSPPGTQPDLNSRWSFDGRLVLRQVQALVGLELRDVHGALTGTGEVSPAGDLTLDAQADLPHLIVAGTELNDARAHLSVNGQAGVISLKEVAGQLYGGQLGGFAELTLRDGRVDYDLSITLHDGQLERYLRSDPLSSRKPSDQSRPIRGSIDGNLFVHGRTGRGGFREGAGEISLREAQVWKLPLLWAIFQVLNLTPDENVFHDGMVQFYLNGDTLILQKIDLQGKAVAFVGGGRMDMNTRQLDVTLLAGSPARVRVPFLTEILEGATRGLMEVHITGTIAKPVILPQPLKSLKKALKTLFPEPPPSQSTPRTRIEPK